MKPVADYRQKADKVTRQLPRRRCRRSPDKVLTVQLRPLEADGVVARTVYPEVPARVEYPLTRHGNNFSKVMKQLDEWGTLYLERQALARQSPDNARHSRSQFCEPLTLLRRGNAAGFQRSSDRMKSLP